MPWLVPRHEAEGLVPTDHAENTGLLYPLLRSALRRGRGTTSRLASQHAQHSHCHLGQRAASILRDARLAAVVVGRQRDLDVLGDAEDLGADVGEREGSSKQQVIH